MALTKYLLPLSFLMALPLQGYSPSFIDALHNPKKVIIELLRKKLLKKSPQGQEAQPDESSSVESLIEHNECPQESSDKEDELQKDSSFKEARAAAARALQQAKMA